MSHFLTSDNHMILFIALNSVKLGPVYTLDSLLSKSNNHEIALSLSFAQRIKNKSLLVTGMFLECVLNVSKYLSRPFWPCQNKTEQFLPWFPTHKLYNLSGFTGQIIATSQWTFRGKEATKEESHERSSSGGSNSNRAPAGRAPASARARVHAQSRSGGGDGVASGETDWPSGGMCDRKSATWERKREREKAREIPPLPTAGRTDDGWKLNAFTVRWW